MSRARGVTAVAVVLMTMGGCAAWGNLGPALMGGQHVRDQITDTTVRMAVTRYAASDTQLTPEERERATIVLRNLSERWATLLDQPGVRASAISACVFGLMACASGVGMLALAGWSWWLAAAQAVGTVVASIAAWPIAMRVARQVTDAIGQLPPDTAAQAQVHHAMEQFLTLSVGASLASGIVWNLWLLWWLNRRSVKDQFFDSAEVDHDVGVA